MSNIFFTSDTHFFHNNLINYCPESRGHFSSVEEMNENLINRWNSVVRERDSVYHLGDFSFANNVKLTEIVFDRLNGIKHLIVGNHDHKIGNCQWASINPYKELRKMNIVLFHYPIEVWNGKHHGTFHFHGHSHHNPFDKPEKPIVRRFDVGADNNNLTPISFEEIIDRLKNENRYEINRS